jgi:hypothetical protein
LTAAELYERCLQKEKTIEEKDYALTLQKLFRGWLFNSPLFQFRRVVGRKAFDKFNKNLFPFTFFIVPRRYIPSEKRASWKYGQLLQNLKKLPDRELRCLLVARLLKQEGICEPNQFLSDHMLRDLTKRFSKREHLSPGDLRDGIVINTWVPYFQRLRADFSTGKTLRRPKEEVAKLGYDNDAIQCVAFHRRSLVQAACAWVAKRKNKRPETLRNIYSRVYGRKYEFR